MNSTYSRKALLIIGFGTLLIGGGMGAGGGYYYGQKTATAEATAKCDTYLKSFISATAAQRHREEVERRLENSRKYFDRVESHLNGFHDQMSQPTLKGNQRRNQNSGHNQVQKEASQNANQ